MAEKSNMTMSDSITQMSTEEEFQLKNLIRERTGIVIQGHQVENLYSTVSTVMQRYEHTQFNSFMQSLSPSNKDSAELKFLIEGITVGESYFFRDTGQIDFLRNQYLPELIARHAKTDKHLRIWSAGCSDGQELYTLAFLLCDLIPDPQNWHIHLLGTDINNNTLATCLRGFYREWSFRNTSDAIKNRYFHSYDDGYVLNENVKNMAHFGYLNLVEDSFPSLITNTNAMDLILCRNVFIYFDQITVDKVLKKFVQCLVPEGVLMLGASDLIANDITDMNLVQTADTFYYQRHNNQGITKKQPVVTHTKTQLENKPTPRVQLDKNKSTPTPKDKDPIPLLRSALAEEKWQQVNEIADSYLSSVGLSTDVLVFKATAQANLGNLDQAAQLCKQAMEIDPLDKHAHYLSAMVFMELEQLKEAEAAFRKVLFLDTKFLEAHYQLGLLLLRCNREALGLKSLKNALRLAEQGDPLYSLHGAADTNYARMAEVLRNEINLHESVLF